MSGVPWTLWRYAFAEVWRLVLLSTGVLVAVIAFAASVKPLAEGVLGPLEAVGFMVLAVPPMLSYALPFAGGFGATLAYHRMREDNEVTAAHAGGVGHGSVLFPAVATGLLMTAGLVALNEQVIPRFLQRMERMITLDVADLLVRSMQSGETAALDGVLLHADGIRRVSPREGSGALSALYLSGVAAVELDGERRVESDVTARRAWVEVYPGARVGLEGDGLGVVITLEEAVGRARGGTHAFERLNLPAVRVPDAFEDDPKFLTWGELRRLRGEPARMGWVDSRRIALARALALEDAGERLAGELAFGGRVSLERPGGTRLTVRAAGVEEVVPGLGLAGGLRLVGGEGRVVVERLEPGGSEDGSECGGGVARGEGVGGVVVERLEPRFSEDGSESGRAVYRDEAAGAVLAVERAGEEGTALSRGGEGPGQRLRLRLELEGVVTSQGDVVTERSSARFEGLAMRGDPLGVWLARDSAALLAEAGTRESERVAEKAAALASIVEKLGREITSKQHERLAMAASCLVMVVTGAVTALRLRGALPLVVYLFSFVPALGTMLLISAGQQHASGKDEAVGVAIVWSGVGVFGVYALVQWALVARR